MLITHSYKGEKEVFSSRKSEIVIGRMEKDATLGHDQKADRATTYRNQDEVIDLNLNRDKTVSRKHARIFLEGGQHYIEDFGSRWGTRVNGVEIKGKGKMALAPEAVVRIGNTTLLINISPQQPPLTVSVKCLPAVNYSLVHCDVPFLDEVILSNNSDLLLSNIEIKILLPGYAESQKVNISSIPAKAKHTLDPLPRFLFDRQKMRDLAEAEAVAVEVRAQGERVPLDSEVQVKILPPNAWCNVNHEEVLASFVLKESKAVRKVIKRARVALSCLVKERQGFENVLTAHPEPARTIIKAIYFCLQERYDIDYGREPRYYAREWQVVRFPDELLQNLEGTCIDLALLLAACLENRHLNPVIVIVRTGLFIYHALVGCWTKKPLSAEPIIKDGGRLQQLVEEEELLLLDSVGIARGKQSYESFAECESKGKEYLDEACAGYYGHEFMYAIDICAARYRGYEPMPFGGGIEFERGAWMAIFRARREAERLRSSALGVRHLLLGLLSLENSLLEQTITKMGEGSAERVRVTAERSVSSDEKGQRILRETDDWRGVMKRARKKARERGDELVTEANLTRALLETPGNLDKVLGMEGLSRDRCLANFQMLIEGGPVESMWHSSKFL